MSIGRIIAVAIRHLYLYQRSLPLLMEVFFWPVLDLILWGFITLYLKHLNPDIPNIVLFFLGALILWDILYRAQQGISVSFLQEIWSKNLLNLFVSPLRPCEFLLGLMSISITKLFAAATVTALLAWLLYSFNVFILGIWLIPFVINLTVMGWTIGIVTIAMILRYGQEAEVMAWGLAFMVQPVSAVFYPVSVLPQGIRQIAWAIPASYIFEGMRGILQSGGFPWSYLLWATVLNGIYLLLAILLFYRNLRVVKIKGLLMRGGTE